MVVAIDGPAGSGKSTVSRGLASHLAIPHLDTGAYYRAATLAVLRAGIDSRDDQAAMAVVGRARIEPVDGRMTLDGDDVEEEIRGAEVTALVSPVSAIPAVRVAMVAAQRDWVGKHGGRAVVEGRDIGTVVFPDAQLKVFLTADAGERARRRAVERGEAFERHLDAIRRRDTYDASRAASPMRPAEDAVIVDTTGLSVEQVIGQIAAMVATSDLEAGDRDLSDQLPSDQRSAISDQQSARMRRPET
jgi:cytidylate kinase